MKKSSKGIERRFYKRREFSMPMMLSSHKVELKNVSSTGIYFEVVTDNAEYFCTEKSISFELLAKTSTPTLPGRTIRLGGNGNIVRYTLINSCQHKKRWGIALKFNDKLDILFDRRESQYNTTGKRMYKLQDPAALTIHQKLTGQYTINAHYR